MSSQKVGGQNSPNNRIPSGYEGKNVPSDFHIPPVGIEDVDRSIWNLFIKDVPISIDGEDVGVVFAAGERFAARRRDNILRDKNTGQFILPIISVVRKGISLEKNFMGGRGIGIDTGDLVIKQRLSSSDRSYQSLLNKLGLLNQANVASLNNIESSSTKIGNKIGRVATRRNISKKNDEELLSNDKLGQNIYEIVTIPFPQFFIANYEITFWAQYRQHLNQMVERVMANFNPNQASFKLTTPKGYWFVAYFDDEIASEDSDEFPDEERILKHTFQVSIPAFQLAPQNPGDPIPFRRYVSAPQISFGLYTSKNEIIDEQSNEKRPSGDIEKFILNDIVPLDSQGNEQKGRTKQSFESIIVTDPISGNKTVRHVKIRSINPRVGEMVIGAEFIDDIDIILNK